MLDASAPRGCLLTICSSSSEVNFINTSIEGIRSANGSDAVHSAVLCFLGNTKAILRGSRFISNEATALWALDNAVVALTSSSTVKGGTKGWALLASDNARLRLSQSSKVLNNTASPGALWGGGVLVSGTSRLEMSDGSYVSGNRAGLLGGGILADDSAIVRLHDSAITHNMAPGFGMNSTSGAPSSSSIAAAAGGGGGGGGAGRGGNSNNATASSRGEALVAALAAVLSAGLGAGGGLAALGKSSITIESSIFQGNSAGLAGGNLFASADAVITITNTSFVGGKAGVHAGGVYAQGSAVVTLNGSVIRSNAATSGFGGGLHAGGHVKVLLSASDIDGNQARHGGGVVAAGNSTVNITRSFIRNNKAISHAPKPDDLALDAGHGGGVFIDLGHGGGIAIGQSARVVISDGSVVGGNYAGTTGGGIMIAGYSQVLITSNVTIELNNVSFSGAGLYFTENGSAVISDGVRIINNTVGMSSTCGTGGGFSAWGRSCVLVTGHVVIANNSAPLRGSGGGFAIGGDANVTVADQSLLSDNIGGTSGGAVLLANNAKMRVVGGVIFARNRASVGGAIAATGSAAADLASDTVFTNNVAGSSGTDVQAEAGSNITMESSQLRNGTAVVWFRKQCLLGEFLEAGYCQPCPPLTYGLDPTFTRCMQCPSNANCAGDADISPLPDFWHSSRYATQVHACPRKGVCLGGSGDTCAEGYTGHVCGSCMEGYGLQGAWVCAKCGSVGRTVALIAAFAVILFVLASILLHTTLKDNRAGIAAQPRPSDFLKILLRHVQNVAIISTVSMTWPESLSPVFKAVGWALAVGGRELVSFDCLFQDNRDAPDAIPVAIRGVLMNLFAPLVILAAVVLARLLLTACCTAFLRYCIPRRPSRVRLVRLLQQRRQQLLLMQLRQQSQRQPSVPTQPPQQQQQQSSQQPTQPPQQQQHQSSQQPTQSSQQQ
jgi:hypothetical protein